MSIARHIEDKARLLAEIELMRVALDRVTRSAWRLANWNDHNHGYDDLHNWRNDTRAACRAAEPYLLPPHHPNEAD